jgi:hypothetical protein
MQTFSIYLLSLTATLYFVNLNYSTTPSSSYGFLCHIKPFYVTKKNVLCGGALYSGIGNVKVTNKEFEGSLSQFIGTHKGFATREALRRSTQQIYHFLNRISIKSLAFWKILKIRISSWLWQMRIG